jgi:hypothetical protein
MRRDLAACPTPDRWEAGEDIGLTPTMARTAFGDRNADIPKLSNYSHFVR